ncbi:MAG: hypothetical protein IJS90_08745 [Clostridia bacterium]|nr:hypothetical protein [Clostridia bacterium]
MNDFINNNFSGIPVVFTADINTTRGKAAYNTMTGSLNDAALTAKDSIGFGTFHACSPETHANYYIDFILCSNDITVETYRTVTKGIDGRFVSDHFPIYADVTLPEGGKNTVC